MSVRAVFRPDLEGLRAVAVLLVLLFHARIPGFGGGYIGVDVFFVLSGFLITGLLVRELVATGRVDLPAFYARRSRRLLPAAALTLLVTVVVSFLVLPPLRLPDVAGDTVAAAVYFSNMRFALLATDYLGSTLPPSPLLHFWSLGVEEQFYFVWPALLLLTTGTAFRARRVAAGLRLLAITLGATFVLSLGISLWLTDAAQPWAFFSLPARAWELALGALLALPMAARLVPARLEPVLGWAGVSMVVASGLLFNEATVFPGIAALLPTLGSALVIASGLRAAASGAAATRDAVPPAANALRAPESGIAGLRRFLRPAEVLGLAPMRFIGRISYSLYLWHWPILVLPQVVAGDTLPGPARVALGLLSIAVAAASQRWVEDPIRHGRFVGLGSRRSLVMAGAVPLLVAVVSLSLGAAALARTSGSGAAIGGDPGDVPLPSQVVPTVTPRPSGDPTASGDPSTSGDPSATSAPSAPGASASPASMPALGATPVPADLVPTLAAARDDNPIIYTDGCHLDVPTSTPGECVYGDPSSSTTVVLFGDSHAAQWFPALERLAREHGWRLVSLTKSACTPADITVWSGIAKRAYTECDAWREKVMARVARERPALVVMSNSRSYQVMDGSGSVSSSTVPARWDEAVARTEARLVGLAGAVAVIGDTPRSIDEPPVCLSAHLEDASACSLAYARAVDVAYTAREAATAAASGAAWIDPTGWVCRTDPCPTVYGRFLIFRDQHHLTATYSRALASWLDELLPADLPR